MNMRTLILGVGISMGLGALAGAAIPSQADIRACAAEPMDFIKVLNKASGVEVIQALEQVSKALPGVESSIGIENRLIGITAIGVTMAKEDAPAAAATALNAVSDQYKPLVAATAVLISGRKSGAVKRSLLSAVSNEQREAVKSAVDNPRESVLSKNQANVAAQYARLAAQNAFASNDFYLGLKDGSIKGGAGNAGAFARGTGVDLSFFSKAFREYFSSEETMAYLLRLSEETAAQLQADFDTFGSACARCRMDVLKLGFDGHVFWQDFEFTRQLSCETLCELRSLNTQTLILLRKLGVDSVEFDIAINELKDGVPGRLLFYRGNLVLPGVKIRGFN